MYGRKYGLSILRGAPEDVTHMYGTPEDTIKTISVMNHQLWVFPHQRTFNIPAEMEEERRLMYVGVTRAEEKLYRYYKEQAELRSNIIKSDYFIKKVENQYLNLW